MFPWAENDSKKSKQNTKQVKYEQCVGSAVPSYAIPIITLDHSYNKSSGQGERSCPEQNKSRCVDVQMNNDEYSAREVVDKNQKEAKRDLDSGQDSNISDKLFCFESSLKEMQDLQQKEQNADQLIENTNTTAEKIRIVEENPVPEKECLKEDDAAYQGSALPCLSSADGVPPTDPIPAKVDDNNIDEASNQNGRNSVASQDNDSVAAGAIVRTAEHVSASSLNLLVYAWFARFYF